MASITKLRYIKDHEVEQLKQSLAEAYTADCGLPLDKISVAVLLTVCTEWLHNEQALQQDHEVDDTCAECGTIYDTSDGACPVCGSQATG